MSRFNWFSTSSKLITLVTLIGYAGVMTGCGPTATTPESTPVTNIAGDDDHAGHDHDHVGHDHADHDHAGEIDVDGLMPIETTPAPASLDQGISQLVGMRDTIAKGFADDDVDSIHDQLHSIGGLLENVESMIQSSEMSDAVKQQATAAIESLFESFGDVDAKLHGEDGKEYADVSDKINTAIETLANLEMPQ